MKRMKTLIVALLLCCLLAFCFSACKDPNGDGGNGGNGGNDGDDGAQTAVNQYEEFTAIITALIKDFAPQKDKDTDTVAKLAMASAPESVGTVESKKRAAAVAVIENLISADGMSEDSRYNTTANQMAAGNLIYALSIAKALNEKCGIEKDIYNVGMKIVDDSDPDYVSYAVITSNKKTKTAYLYEVDGSVETVYQIYVEYNSDTDYTARMIVLSMDGIIVDASKSEASSYYFYGDTDGRMLYMMGDWKHPQHQTQVVAYREDVDGKCYSTDDAEITKLCFNITKNDYTSIDIELLRSLKDSAENTITGEEFNGIIDSLVEEYGLE